MKCGRRKYYGRRCSAVTRRIVTVFVPFCILLAILVPYFLPRSKHQFSVWSDSSLDQYEQILYQHFTLIENEWRLTLSIEQHKNAVTLDDANCSLLRSIVDKDFVAAGWTKETYKVILNGKARAIKYVNPHGYQVTKCVLDGVLSFEQCYMNAAAKILSEIIRLKSLLHANIIKVLGYCVPKDPELDNKYSISLLTEIGEPINVIHLLQMSWQERLKISLGLADLLDYLSHSPLGSIALNDFRRQQFVLISPDIKLIDVDDIGMSEPPCHEKWCPVHLNSEVKMNSSIFVPCVKDTCQGYNEKLNILNAGRHFIGHILPHGVPAQLVEIVQSISSAYETASWNTSRMLMETKRLSILTQWLPTFSLIQPSFSSRRKLLFPIHCLACSWHSKLKITKYNS